MPELTPEELNELLGKLAEVEAEARTLRSQIEQRLVERRRAEAQDRSGQPSATRRTKGR